MGISVGIEIEDIEAHGIDIDGKFLADIIADITESEDTITNIIAIKHNLDITPFSLVSNDENRLEGPWQPAINLGNVSKKLAELFNLEREMLLGNEIWYNEVDEDSLGYYISQLENASKLCEYANEQGKKVRLVFY